MQQFLARIIKNEMIAKDYYELDFDWPKSLSAPLPGQFLNLRCSPRSTPLLRRPFAFSGYDARKGIASFIYEKRGPGTSLLCEMNAGSPIDVIAPLGNSFQANNDHATGSEPDSKTLSILVSGGIGLGPILFLARSLKTAGSKYTFVHGVREQGMLPETESLNGLDPVFCTDDGSSVFHGKTTEYLETIEEKLPHPFCLYACGPLPMLKACHAFAEKRSAECYVSMEATMACGFGACMGCVVKVAGTESFARVCTEGPIFSSREILWT